METLALTGRILYLAADEAQIVAQLAGRRLARADVGALRDDVSTDEITPVPILTHYDDKLGRYPYTGLSVAGIVCLIGMVFSRGSWRQAV